MNFSPNDMYTHQVVEYARELKAKYFADMSIELIDDGAPNAYVYKTESLVKTADIFGEWFRTMSTIKAKYPKNKLVKNILSSTYGRMTEFHKVYLDSDDRKKRAEIEADDSLVYLKFQYYKEKLQYVYRRATTKYHIRLVPFLTGLARVKMAQTIAEHRDKVVRVVNDGAVFSEPVDLNVPGLVKEDKYCGHVLIKRGRRPVQIA